MLYDMTGQLQVTYLFLVYFPYNFSCLLTQISSDDDFVLLSGHSAGPCTSGLYIKGPTWIVMSNTSFKIIQNLKVLGLPGYPFQSVHNEPSLMLWKCRNYFAFGKSWKKSTSCMWLYFRYNHVLKWELAS